MEELMKKLSIVWKEMEEQIPLMREAVRKDLKKDFETFEHDDAHIQQELYFLNEALHFLQKKWTMDLIYIIRIKGKPFFNDIRRALPNINSRTLTTRLKEFEENHIVTRTVTNTQPIRVSYELTELGNGVYELLIPLLIFFAREKTIIAQKENLNKSEQTS
ncbi:MAG: winged helix-turn-helix transcriptional regulator [Candidatus Thorarchaeota archaeon]